jgi:hypothetical protein
MLAIAASGQEGIYGTVRSCLALAGSNITNRRSHIWRIGLDRQSCSVVDFVSAYRMENASFACKQPRDANGTPSERPCGPERADDVQGPQCRVEKMIILQTCVRCFNPQKVLHLAECLNRLRQSTLGRPGRCICPLQSWLLCLPPSHPTSYQDLV